MLFYFIVLLAAVVVAAGATENLRSDKVTEQAHGGAFTIGGHAYTSKEEFVRFGKIFGTNELSEEEKYEVDQKLVRMGNFEEMDTEKRKKLKVDTYFHIITDTAGNGALTKKEVKAQIKILNAGFKQSKVKFILKGTTTSVNDVWFGANQGSAEEKDMKSALRVGGVSTLNIYTSANTLEYLGWAYYPFFIPLFGLSMDGVVVDYRTLPGGSAVPYNEGKNLIHGVGLWIGLYQVFQGGCDVTNGGDFVKDTPAVAGPNIGPCPAESTDSCPLDPGNDLVNNFMDLADEACRSEFTKGQQDRMYLMWEAFRS